MTTFFPDTLLSSLLDDLENLESVLNDDTVITLQCAERTATALQELNEYLRTAQFTEQSQEIKIFKQIKPQIEGRLVYYFRLLSFQQLAPQNAEHRRLSFFERHENSVQKWLNRNKADYFYYRIGAIHLDTCYFLRQDYFPILGPNAIRMATDRAVQTFKSYQFALFWAAELLLRYFQQQREHLGLTEKQSIGNENMPAITWTGSQADLTELVYALNEMGVLGNRRHEIQKVKIFFEKIFNINLGNIYKTYEHNRLRKKSRTPFLDGARMALMRRYDHDDEHAL